MTRALSARTIGKFVKVIVELGCKRKKNASFSGPKEFVSGTEIASEDKATRHRVLQCWIEVSMGYFGAIYSTSPTKCEGFFNGSYPTSPAF